MIQDAGASLVRREMAMDPSSDARGQRATFLSVMLSIMAGSIILFGSFLLCGGLTLALLAVVAGLVAFGCLHYLLWGHFLSREVAAERGREQAQSEEESTDPSQSAEWTPEERDWYQRF
jgi:hypothetical protein